MTDATLYILASTAFRLAIIASGTVCAVLGYRLFIDARRSEASSTGESGTSLEAGAVGATFRLSQAAPGTCFAAFGGFLITVMLITGAPSYEETEAGGLAIKGEGDPPVESGDGEPTFTTLARQGLDQEKRRRSGPASASYRRAMDLLALPANQTALEHLKQGRTAQALRCAESAVRLSPDNADAWDTLSEVCSATRKPELAEQHLRVAADLDPGKYAGKLNELRGR